MEVEKLKQEIASILSTAQPPRDLLEAAIEEVLFALEISGHSRAAQTRKLCGEGGPLHEEALELLKNMSILLVAADEMQKQPGLFEVFALACMEIYPPPDNDYLKLIASTQARIDLISCHNDMKSKFFKSHFLVE